MLCFLFLYDALCRVVCATVNRLVTGTRYYEQRRVHSQATQQTGSW
jgi:hypothetical protein